MLPAVFFLYRPGEHPVLDIVVDHTGGKQALAIHSEQLQLLVQEGDDLIHIQLQFGKPFPLYWIVGRGGVQPLLEMIDLMFLCHGDFPPDSVCFCSGMKNRRPAFASRLFFYDDRPVPV